MKRLSLLDKLKVFWDVSKSSYWFAILLIGLIIIAYIFLSTNKKNAKKNKTIYIGITITVLVLLPLLVQVVIMMVNGNLGTSVAILGAFSLIRFRSMPGTSRELLSIFETMAIGLSIGMGHIIFAVVFTILISLTLLVLSKIKFGEKPKTQNIKILIPEELDYTNVFEDILNKYTKKHEILKVKTTNLGSMYEITYNIELKEINEKEFIDELRTRNGNLNITLNHELKESGEL